MAENKIAFWLCPCGAETKQEAGHGIKIITHCPKCGKEHFKLREPDGSITEFVNAPDWFIQEWNEHMRKIQERDLNFKHTAFQEYTFAKKKAECYDLLVQAQKKTDGIMESGLRRLKLLKRKEIQWGFNPAMKKFVGRPAPIKGADKP